MSRLPGPNTPLGHLTWGTRLVRDLYGTLVAAHERWGPIVQIGHGPMRYVYVFGPEANELVLTDRTGFTWREAFASLIPVTGETAMVVSDGDDHARRRRLVQPAFALRRIRSYAPVVVDETGRTLAHWQPGNRIDVHTEMQATVRRIAVRSLFGDALGRRSDEMGDHLRTAIDFANLPHLPGRNLNLPGLPYRRAQRARRAIDAIVDAELARRRSHPAGDEAGDEGDLLGALLAAEDDDGAQLSDGEVRDQVVSLVAAGYETTAALVAWCVYAVLREPAVEARLRAELVEVFGDGPAADVDPERVDDCPYLHAVVTETLRLHPPAGISARRAQVDVPFAGHTIPVGSTVVWSPYVTHRQPDLWPDPLVFRPERWIGADGRPVEAAPHTFVPFGGGYRRCIGFALATLETKLALAQVLRHHRLRLDRRDIRGAGIAALTPRGGVPVTVLAPERDGAPVFTA